MSNYLNNDTNNISIKEDEILAEKIQIIIRHTNYSNIVAREKLEEFNYDEKSVIKSYLGIPEKKENSITSINQEIYKQLRNYLNNSTSNYRKKNP